MYRIQLDTSGERAQSRPPPTNINRAHNPRDRQSTTRMEEGSKSTDQLALTLVSHLPIPILKAEAERRGDEVKISENIVYEGKWIKNTYNFDQNLENQRRAMEGGCRGLRVHSEVYW